MLRHSDSYHRQPSAFHRPSVSWPHGSPITWSPWLLCSVCSSPRSICGWLASPLSPWDENKKVYLCPWLPCYCCTCCGFTHGWLASPLGSRDQNREITLMRSHWTQRCPRRDRCLAHTVTALGSSLNVYHKTGCQSTRSKNVVGSPGSRTFSLLLVNCEQLI